MVWQKVHELVLLTYQLTASFPEHKMYGLPSLCRRAAVSFAANFAEGYKKESKLDEQIEEVSRLLTACTKAHPSKSLQFPYNLSPAFCFLNSDS